MWPEKHERLEKGHSPVQGVTVNQERRGTTYEPPSAHWSPQTLSKRQAGPPAPHGGAYAGCPAPATLGCGSFAPWLAQRGTKPACS